ncbi:MAG: GlmU family protein [Chitinophagaceae bacterium]
MQLVLFDDSSRKSLFPFTHTRAIADIRCGILTMRERWEHTLNLRESSTLTEPYLQELSLPSIGHEFLLINGSLFPSKALLEAIYSLSFGAALYSDGKLLALRIHQALPAFSTLESFAKGLESNSFSEEINFLEKPWDIFSKNEDALKNDFEMLTDRRSSAPIPADVTVSGSEIFIEDEATIQPGTIINATTGPVYIGRGAEVMEGCLIRGPFALCEGATLKMGAKVYGGTTIGPECKVGGEISNTVFFGNSNKGHDGFLGNAVIGEWCNLGADTNASNLKNNYDSIKIWDEAAERSVKTELTFCGLLMGDHSKCGINTMFNTGSVVGVSCNIWGGEFPEKFIPSFSWGGAAGMSTYQLPQAMNTADRMMARRGKSLSIAERGVFKEVFEQTVRARDLVFGGK